MEDAFEMPWDEMELESLIILVGPPANTDSSGVFKLGVPLLRGEVCRNGVKPGLLFLFTVSLERLKKPRGFDISGTTGVGCFDCFLRTGRRKDILREDFGFT